MDILQAIEEAKARGISLQPDRRNLLFRGANFEIQSWCGGEVIISGPAETGKTISSLHRLHCDMLDNPGAQAVIVRKRQVDMAGTCLQTFQEKVLTDGSDVTIYGGTKPERFIYKNGSTIWVGGMDKPGKVLSGERDFIYVNQAEELTLDDWETLQPLTVLCIPP